MSSLFKDKNMEFDGIAVKFLDVFIGHVFAYAGENLEKCFIVCDGREISRTEYPKLFLKIGTMYGSGDGKNTFNVPNYEGFFLRGFDTKALVDCDSDQRLDRGDGRTGRFVGTIQLDLFSKHSHRIDHSQNMNHNHDFKVEQQDITHSHPSHWHEIPVVSGDEKKIGGLLYGFGSQVSQLKTSSTADSFAGTSTNFSIGKTSDFTGTGSYTGESGQTGGGETRPKNKYVIYAIFAGI